MKNSLLLSLLILLCLSCQESNQIDSKPAPVTEKPASTLPDVDTSIFETFSYQEGDTTFLMKKYFMVHLKKGPNRDQDKKDATVIQEAHLAHLSKLAEDKKLCIAGPFEGDSIIQGMAIYSVPNLAIADSLANADPAVKAGRLTVDVFPFWAAVGSQLY